MAGKKTGKRLLTWVLVLVMALSLLPLNALAKNAWSDEYDWIRIYLDDATNKDLEALNGLSPQVRIVSPKYPQTEDGMRACAPRSNYWWTENNVRKVTANKITSIDLAGDKAIGSSNKISIPIQGNETYEVTVSEGYHEGITSLDSYYYLRIDISKRTPHKVSYRFEGEYPTSAQLPADDFYTATTRVALAAVPANVTDDGAGYSWTFEEWTVPAGITLSNGTFTMPDNDVTITGKWEKKPVQYSISYNLGGGALAVGESNPTAYTVETDSFTLKEPTRQGYTFAGWTGTDLTNAEKDVTVAQGSTGNRTYTATWTPSGNVTYKVEHYCENLDGTYPTDANENEEVITGTTGETVTATAKSYPGFTFDETVTGTVKSGEVLADGSLVLQLYYTRNSYTVTYQYDGNAPTDAAPALPQKTSVKFGDTVQVVAAPTSSTHTFSGWSASGGVTIEDNKFTMPAGNVILTGTWTPKETEPNTVTINLSDYIKKDLTVTGNGFQGETFTVTVTGDSESGGGQFTGSVTYAANEGNASLKAFTDWKVVHSPTGDNYVFNDNGTITFKKVTTGTAYSFTVDEAKGGTEEMDYDGSSRSFNVWVGTDKESGKLKITKTSKPITLENHYNGTFPVALGQYINKVYKSECGCAPKTTFRFEALIEERVPEANALSLIESVPVEKESKVYTAKGSVTLKAGTEQTADMSIQLPAGIYEVTLKEVNDKTANVKYDKTVYTFRISVFEYDGNVEIGFSDVKKDGKEYNEQGFVFTNSYVHRHFIPVSPKPSKPTLNTGDHYAYVMGYPDGTVRPNGSITRAEVSAILFRLLSDKTRDEYFTTESSFTDVKAGAWYNNSIATLEKAGVIVDTAKGGAFRPNEAITRAELAAMLAQFSDAKPVKGVKFSDVSAEHWAYEAIAIAAKMGWIEGYPDGTFRPDATITRAEMMTLVNRALERVPSDEDHLLSKRVMLTFPDCKSGDWFYIAVQEATNSHTYERAATEKNGDEQWTALRANRDWTLLEK